jgi:hypothetical protein
LVFPMAEKGEFTHKKMATTYRQTIDSCKM